MPLDRICAGLCRVHRSIQLNLLKSNCQRDFSTPAVRQPIRGMLAGSDRGVRLSSRNRVALLGLVVVAEN